MPTKQVTEDQVAKGIEELVEKKISLYKHFEEAGDKDKNMMITLITFLLPILWGLIAFILYDKDALSSTQLMASIATVLLSAYSLFIIHELLWHAEKQYEIANLIVRVAITNGKLKTLLAPDPETCILTRQGFSKIHCGKIFVVFWFGSLLTFGLSLFLLWKSACSVSFCVISL